MNLITNCFELVAEIYGNRPENADGTLALYCEEDRNILLKTIDMRKRELVSLKEKISEATYDLLMAIYDFVRARLEDKQI